MQFVSYDTTRPLLGLEDVRKAQLTGKLKQTRLWMCEATNAVRDDSKGCTNRWQEPQSTLPVREQNLAPSDGSRWPAGSETRLVLTLALPNMEDEATLLHCFVSCSSRVRFAFITDFISHSDVSRVHATPSYKRVCVPSYKPQENGGGGFSCTL